MQPASAHAAAEERLAEANRRWRRSVRDLQAAQARLARLRHDEAARAALRDAEAAVRAEGRNLAEAAAEAARTRRHRPSKTS